MIYKAGSLGDLLFDIEEAPKGKYCEWCNGKLPEPRYHLVICPQCRKGSIQAYTDGKPFDPLKP